MPMDPAILKTLIKTKVQAKNDRFAPDIGDNMDWLFEAVAEAVVEHIVSSALVTVTVASVSGVTVGGGTSGPGAGTGTIG